MIHPNIDEFRKLAVPGALVPVYRERLADLETPVSAYMKVARDEPYSFLFESVEQADVVGRYSFLGGSPSVLFRSKGQRVIIERAGHSESFETDNPLDALRDLMSIYRPIEIEGLPTFHGGAVGYMAYDEVRFFEKLPDKNPDDLEMPDLYFLIADTLVIFDHVGSRLKIVANVMVGDNPDADYADALRRIDAIEEKLTRPLALAQSPVPDETLDTEIRSNFTEEAFCEVVERGKEYIRAGDIFQVVLSQRFERDVHSSPTDLYRALRCINPSPYMILMEFPDFAIVGSSPEVMTQVKDGRCVVRPIAGTRPRGDTVESDLEFERELMADEKELAEHIMLVDLGRNDVGRVSEIGSVRPTQLMTVERYSHVMHIVSQVEGDMRPDADAYDALRATFPMGTVSGAPKIRAMEIIDELEPVRRGSYSGGCGYISFDGDMDTCILIRTMVVKDGVAYLQAGAGIVYDSEPKREYEETQNKAKAMFRAVELAERGLEL